MENFLRKTKKGIKTALLGAGILFATKDSNASLPNKTIDFEKYVATSNMEDSSKRSEKENTPIFEVGEPGDNERGVVKESEGKIEMNLANYFETDKADIGIKGQEEIKDLLKKYISYIDSKNVDVFLNQEAKIIGSSDPRKTSTWEQGNFGLTQARLLSVQEVVIDLLNEDDSVFNKELSKETISKIKEKLSHLLLDIPMTRDKKGYGENGVEDFHTIVNPETGKVFTEEEWHALSKNKELQQKVYESMRKVSLSLGIEIPKVNTEKVETTTSGSLLENPVYKEIIYVIDASPSMRKSKEDLSNELIKSKISGIDKPVSFYTFTENIEESISVQNQEEAAEVLKNLKINENTTIEYGVRAIKNVLERTTPSKDKKVLIMSTDEELQNVSGQDIEKIKELSVEKNIDVFCKVKYGEAIYTLSLTQLSELYNETAKKENVSDKVETRKKIHEINVKYLENYKKELSETSDNKKQKNLRKEISEIEKSIQETSDREKEHPSDAVTITNFKSLSEKK